MREELLCAVLEQESYQDRIIGGKKCNSVKVSYYA